VDVKKCKQNIHRMASKARKHSLKFRPHFKTHQSIAIGEWFKEEGVEAITVSSLEMANYFRMAGWMEITLAMPINLNLMSEIAQLSSEISLNVLVDTVEAVNALRKDGNLFNVYIEIDSGANRSGVRFEEINVIFELVSNIKKAENLNLVGFYSHAGHTYGARSTADLIKIGSKAKSNFLSIKKHLEEDNQYEFCFGDTPSCSVLDDFEGIDAISPGNFVFYDVMQAQIGACSLDDIAIHMSCPVISKKRPQNILVHGGAIHFSKDSVDYEGSKIFGLAPNLTNAHLIALSQEHGILKVSENSYKNIEIGDAINVLPIHSCLTAQSMGGYIGPDLKIDHLAQKKVSH